MTPTLTLTLTPTLTPTLTLILTLALAEQAHGVHGQSRARRAPRAHARAVPPVTLGPPCPHPTPSLPPAHY